MKSVLPLLSIAVLAASCSSVYKSGQTPDDVYFSPERPQEEYVRVENAEDRYYRSQQRRNDAYYDDYYSYNEDRYLRMRVRNRRQWSNLDFYYSDPYAFRYNNIFLNTYWGPYSSLNPYTFWNFTYNPYFYNPYFNSFHNYYSPYYGNKVIVTNPRNPVFNRPRTTNLHVFDSPQYPTNTPRNRNYRNNGTYSGANDGYRPQRNRGSDMRDLFRGGSSNNNNGGYSPSRPSSTMGNSNSNSGGSNSGSRGSGGNAPTRRF